MNTVNVAKLGLISASGIVAAPLAVVSALVAAFCFLSVFGLPVALLMVVFAVGSVGMAMLRGVRPERGTRAA